MKAWQVHEYGPYQEVMHWEDIPAPVLPEAGVVFAVKAVPLQFMDALSVAGQYQIKAPLPFIPGSEAMGVVLKAGSKSRFSPGDRVVAGGLVGACAEQMAALDMVAEAVPDDVSDTDAPILRVTYETACLGLGHRAGLQAGETLLVQGAAGGVGLAAVQVGKALGARVIAVAGGPEKARVCRENGADLVIDHQESDFVQEVKSATGGRGADVVFEPVGGEIFTRSTKCIAWGGRVLVVGFASGEIPTLAVNRALVKHFSVVGFNVAGYFMHAPQAIADARAQILAWYRAGKLKPVVHAAFPMKEAIAAFDEIAQRRVCGKVVLTA